MRRWSDEGPIEGALRVLVADDQAVFRRGLCLVLDHEEDIVVVGEAGSGREVVALARRTAPDVVLVDVRMPGMGGIEATHLLAREVPAARVVMLTFSDAGNDLYEAIRAGAVGYVLKGSSIDDVVDAVRAAASGQSLVTPVIAARLLREVTVLAQDANRSAPLPGPSLTALEVRVIGGIARGRPESEVAECLFFPEEAVVDSVRRVLEKLQHHARGEVAAVGAPDGIVDADR